MISGWTVAGTALLAGLVAGIRFGEASARAGRESDDLRRAMERTKSRTRVPLWRRGYLTADGRLTTLAGAAFFHAPVSAAEITRAIWQLAPPRSLPEHAEYLARVAGHVVAARANHERQKSCWAAQASMN